MAKATVSKLKPWPVVWRVVAPNCGSYDHDMRFLETENEMEARGQLVVLRRRGWPVRLERIQVGPLPRGYKAALGECRAANPQNPDTRMLRVAAAWTEVSNG